MAEDDDVSPGLVRSGSASCRRDSLFKLAAGDFFHHYGWRVQPDDSSACVSETFAVDRFRLQLGGARKNTSQIGFRRLRIWASARKSQNSRSPPPFLVEFSIFDAGFHQKPSVHVQVSMHCFWYVMQAFTKSSTYMCRCP